MSWPMKSTTKVAMPISTNAFVTALIVVSKSTSPTSPSLWYSMYVPAQSRVTKDSSCVCRVAPGAPAADPV